MRAQIFPYVFARNYGRICACRTVSLRETHTAVHEWACWTSRTKTSVSPTDLRRISLHWLELQFHSMRVPDFEVRSNSHFTNVWALFWTHYLLVSKHFIAQFQYILRPRVTTSSDTAIYICEGRF